MKYSGLLAKKEREKIFELFLDKERLKFSEIEKSIKIRSNMVAYHIEQMIKEKILEKKGEYYLLTSGAEQYIPTFEHITGKSQSPLPVILVALVNKERILMIKRNKRPYKGYWSMIGGKMFHDETFESATVRMAKTKAGLGCKFVSINTVLHERVLDNDEVKHSFILFFTKAVAKTTKFVETGRGTLKWFKISDLKKRDDIIPSDHYLIRHKIGSSIDAHSATMQEKNGRVGEFRIN